MCVYTRVTSITNDVLASYKNSIWKLNANSFTRDRKMNYESLVKSIILKKGRTLTLELDEIADNMKIEKITKQA